MKSHVGCVLMATLPGGRPVPLTPVVNSAGRCVNERVCRACGCCRLFCDLLFTIVLFRNGLHPSLSLLNRVFDTVHIANMKRLLTVFFF